MGIYTEKFAESLKRLKEEKDVSYSDIAKAINIPRGTLYNYASSRNSFPIDVAIDIAIYFNTTVEEMLDEPNSGYAKVADEEEEYQ